MEEQVELECGEVDRGAIDEDLAGRRGDDHVVELERTVRWCPALGPAEDGSDPGGQLPCAERLDDVVVGAELQAGHSIGFVLWGREHDHRDLGAASDITEHLETVDSGEHDIEDDQIGLLGFDEGNSGASRRCLKG